MEDALKEAILVVGSRAALARELSKLPAGRITQQAIGQWSRVPAARTLDVEKVSGVSRHRLRPDFYPSEERINGEAGK